jgi:hypothetical protein
MDGPRVCWISGGAGTGKSTIATTVCETLEKEGLLACSYFISRQSDGRHDARGIVRTLAYDLAQTDSDFFAVLLNLLREDSRITNGLVVDQLKNLIAKPLGHMKHSIGPRVLVLDAFDECDKDKDGREGGQLLSLLMSIIYNADNLIKLLITSRPEQTMEDMMSEDVDAGRIQKEDLQSIPAAQVQADIRRYLTKELERISSKRGLAAWPSPSDLNELVRRAGILFLYVSTVIKFVGASRYSPPARLSVVLNTSGSSTQSQSFYKQLDSLCTQLLYTVVQNEGMLIIYDGSKQPGSQLVDSELCRRLQIVVGSIILLRDTVSASTLGDLLPGEDRDEIQITTRMLSSVLYVAEGQPIRTLHPSFSEFMLDNKRCSDPRFQINQGERHLHLALGCLLVMNTHLRHDICSFADPSLLNTDIGDLQERIDTHIPPALQYACKY